MSPAMTTAAYALSAMRVVGLLGLTAYMVVELCGLMTDQISVSMN